MEHRRPTAELPDVFRGTHAVAAGLLTARHLRGPHVVRLFRDVYRPAWVPLTHELACRGLSLVMPRTGRLTGRSLSALRGVTLAWPDDEVEIALHHGSRCELAGVRPSRTVCADLGTEQLGGMPVVGALRMGFDLAATWPLDLATAHLDAVVDAGLLDLEEFRRWLRTRHDDHVEHVRRASELVVTGAESVPESQVRVVLQLAGIGTVPQYVVRHGGRFVARVDLAVEGLRLAVEYDGRHHGLGAQLSRDRQRHNRLVAAGWTVVYVTAEQLRQPKQLTATVRAAMAQAAVRAA